MTHSQRPDVSSLPRQAPPRWRRPMLLAPLLAAVALAAALVWRVGPPEHSTLKGGTAILASVKRNGAFLLQDRDAQTLQDLQPGDQLSIHVVGTAPLMAFVQVAEEGVWKEYYRGEVPQSGWLPVGLEVSTGEPTQVRIAVCAVMSPANCQRVALEL